MIPLTHKTSHPRHQFICCRRQTVWLYVAFLHSIKTFPSEKLLVVRGRTIQSARKVKNTKMRWSAVKHIVLLVFAIAVIPSHVWNYKMNPASFSLITSMKGTAKAPKSILVTKWISLIFQLYSVHYTKPPKCDVNLDLVQSCSLFGACSQRRNLKDPQLVSRGYSSSLRSYLITKAANYYVTYQYVA